MFYKTVRLAFFFGRLFSSRSTLTRMSLDSSILLLKIFCYRFAKSAIMAYVGYRLQQHQAYNLISNLLLIYRSAKSAIMPGCLASSAATPGVQPHLKPFPSVIDLPSRPSCRDVWRRLPRHQAYNLISNLSLPVDRRYSSCCV